MEENILKEANQEFANVFDQIWPEFNNSLIQKIKENDKITDKTLNEIKENIKTKARKKTLKSTVKIQDNIYYDKRAGNLMFEIIYNATIKPFFNNRISISKKELKILFTELLKKKQSKS